MALAQTTAKSVGQLPIKHGEKNLSNISDSPGHWREDKSPKPLPVPWQEGFSFVCISLWGR